MVTLTVTEGNTAAMALYQSMGFVAFGTEPLAIATPGGFKAKVHMWLDLAPPTPAAHPTGSTGIPHLVAPS